MTNAPTFSDRCSCSCGRLLCASRRLRGPAEMVHGSIATYSQGCRCAPCISAHTVKAARQRKRVNTRTRDGAVRNGAQWTGPELEIATRADLTAAEAAALIGRTMQAVKNMRFKCRHDPKFLLLLGAADERMPA